jgi:hypothetical protein
MKPSQLQLAQNKIFHMKLVEWHSKPNRYDELFFLVTSILSIFNFLMFNAKIENHEILNHV